MRITSLVKFGAMIREARNKRGLTQGELGKMAGINQATLSLLESGSSSTSLKTILVLMSVLNLDMDISPRETTDLKGDEW